MRYQQLAAPINAGQGALGAGQAGRWALGAGLPNQRWAQVSRPRPNQRWAQVSRPRPNQRWAQVSRPRPKCGHTLPLPGRPLKDLKLPRPQN
jgi:hypothetical protein